MEKIVKFGDIELEKQKGFINIKKLFQENLDVNKIAVSNKVPFGKK